MLTQLQVFESLDGLATVTLLFKRRGTPREVKLKILEFLYFYLMDETPKVSSGSEGISAKAARQHCKTTEEKQTMLAEYMANVDRLVADLKESQPFGM
jgi:hypothetical protein